MQIDNYWGPASAFMSSTTWALGVSAYTILSKKYPAYIVNFTRVLISLPFFLTLVVFRDQWSILWQQWHNPSRVGWALAAVISSFALADMLYLWAAKRVGPSSALAIASIYPLWAALLGVFFKGEVLDSQRILGVLLVVAGTVTVVLAPSTSSQNSPAVVSRKVRLWGYGLALLTSFGWAFNTYAVVKSVEGLDVATGNVFRFSLALLMVPLIGISVEGIKSFKLISWKDFKSVSFIFVAETLGGPVFYVYGLANSPLAIGAALTSLAPVLSVPVSVLMKLERFSAQKTWGVILVTTGIFALVLKF